jgi:hypothetical protein
VPKEKTMKIRSRLVALTTILTTFSILGLAGIVAAAPDDSQRLRGLGDRVFLVTAELTVDRLGIGLPIGTTLPNCYIFNAEADADGYNWFESAFPDVKGTWAQDSNGAKTSYGVEASNAVSGDQITQWGRVTPARGKGVLQLEADSFVDIIPGGPAELEFYSVGEEIHASEVESKCPTFPMFTFPE